jgi:hypothetical protein
LTISRTAAISIGLQLFANEQSNSYCNFDPPVKSNPLRNGDPIDGFVQEMIIEVIPLKIIAVDNSHHHFRCFVTLNFFIY